MSKLRVWKYDLHLYWLDAESKLAVVLPEGARILSVVNQEGLNLIHNSPMLQLYALVDPDAPPRERTIWVHGTGHPVYAPTDEGATFIGTVLMNQSTMVWHVWAK
jgi:hypothetical protein